MESEKKKLKWSENIREWAWEICDHFVPMAVVEEKILDSASSQIALFTLFGRTLTEMRGRKMVA